MTAPAADTSSRFEDFDFLDFARKNQRILSIVGGAALIVVAGGWLWMTSAKRKEAAAAESLVEREVAEFLAWRRSLDVVPLVVELRRRAEQIRRAEIDKVRSRLGTLTPEQENAVEALTSGIVNKLLHGPTVSLKESAPSHHEHVRLIRRLFGL